MPLLEAHSDAQKEGEGAVAGPGKAGAEPVITTRDNFRSTGRKCMSTERPAVEISPPNSKTPDTQCGKVIIRAG